MVVRYYVDHDQMIKNLRKVSYKRNYIQTNLCTGISSNRCKVLYIIKIFK